MEPLDEKMSLSGKGQEAKAPIPVTWPLLLSHLENQGHSGFRMTQTPLLGSLMHTHAPQELILCQRRLSQS